MDQRLPVPIVEINPADPTDIEIAFIPLADIDDFLEDISDDYALGLGELGKISGKIKAKGRVRGHLRIATPKIKLRASIGVKKKGRAKQPKARKTSKTKKFTRLSGRLKKVVKVAAGAKKILKVKKGKFPAIPLNRTALVKKAKAKATAVKLATLGTGTTGFTPRAKHIVKAAILGKPLRPKGLPKPVAQTVKRVRDANVQCCIVAQHKTPGLGRRAGTLAEKYAAKKKLTQASQFMGPLRFRATVQGLLGKLQDMNGSEALAKRIARIRKVTGIRV